MEQPDLVALTADIVSAHVAHNNVAVGDLSRLIAQVHGALAGLGSMQEPEPDKKSPMVSVRASVKPDFIICMECGRKQTTMKRHLQTAHGMTPQQYREDYGLPDTYPMTAPNYSEKRKAMAKALGLGRKRGEIVKPKPADGNDAAPAAEAGAAKPRGREKAARDDSARAGQDTAPKSRGRRKKAAPAPEAAPEQG